MTTVDAVVLAGGRNSPEMRDATGVENRALTPLGTRTMLDCVASALQDASGVGQIVVVGDVPPSQEYRRIAGGETLLDNLLAGVEASGGERVLVSTSDIPFLTAAAVDDFVRRSLESGADLCCSYVPLALCLARFPDMKRTAVKLREGRFTLGNLMLVNPRFLQSHRETIQSAYDARKSPVGVARLLGVGLLARLLAAQTLSPALLSVARLEAAVGGVIGGRAAAIRSEYPEIGTDVDKPEDVKIARRLLAE